MFSITAINDKETGGKWETLAPSKEAQEFRLSQNYHDGLVNLHAKDYIKARELLEAVLKDPLVTGAVGSNASDSHLLQLRFLTLKNLAAVFLQQGATHYDNALQCYLQAVEIDDKDPVVWNQLGTLSCSMRLLSTSRWAFEQGLLCSPNNWNCMEKLLEVLIAIGDEVSCLSITNLILRHWPSHSRALHVKKTIEYAEPIQFAPRGIDKLEPKHARLSFSTKRKGVEDGIEKSSSKRQNQNVEIYLSRVTWEALADAILDVMVSENLRTSGQKIECTQSATENEIESNGQAHIAVGRNGESMDPENCKRSLRCTDIKIIIHLSPSVESVKNTAKGKVVSITSGGECLSLPDYDFDKIGTVKEHENYTEEDHPQGRRSTRLGRLRSRKPEKEDLDSFSGKDMGKAVLRFLEPFILKKSKPIDQNFSGSYGPSSDVLEYSSKDEYNDVKSFATVNSRNCGAYHIGHLLLEEVAHKSIPYQNNFDKFLQLEKLTRLCGQDRTPLCTLFLAELYYDHGLHTDDDLKRTECFTEASYHLCKVIELVSLDFCPVGASFHTEMKDSNHGSTNVQCISDSIACGEGDENGEAMVEESVRTQSKVQSTVSTDGSLFWVRFFWLSGCLSISSGGKRKAIKELSICLSILRNRKNSNDSDGIIPLPHCRVARSLTVDRIHHQLSLLRIDSLLRKAIKMTKKGRHKSCIDLLSPLFLSAKDVYPDFVCGFIREGFRSVEVQALDVLISACEKEEAIDIEVYLNSHKRKLQILICATGMINPLGSGKNNASSEPKMSTTDSNRTGNGQQHWNQLIYEEIKAISRTVSRVKSIIEQGDSYGDSNAVFCTVGEIQSLLVWVMCDAVRTISSQKICGVGAVSQSDQLKSGSLVDAAIAFCKLQHLDPTVPIKAQVELIVSVHDLLAEYGLCCAGKDIEGEEGTFLKLAIKHLLALDVKLKSNYHSSCKKSEMKQVDESFPVDDHGRSAALKPKELSSSDACAVGEDECAQQPEECTEEAASESSARARLGSIDEEAENGRDGTDVKSHSSGENSRDCNLVESEDLLEDLERAKVELGLDNALDQSFFCLYGLNLKTGQDSSSEDDLATHKNTNRGDFQTKEQCADVFQYILPYARASSRAGIVKLRRILRAIRKHFPQPPDDILARNAFNKFLEDPELSEDDLCEVAGSDRGQEAIISKLYPDVGLSGAGNMSSGSGGSEPYAEVYSNLYYFIAQAEEMSATDKVPGFVLKKEGEEFVEQSANLFKYDLMYNPLRFESWQKLANIYDEEVDLLLNDGSKHINAVDWKRSHNLPQRVEMGRRRSRRCLLMSLALASTPDQRSQVHELLGLVYYDSLQNVVPFYDQRSVVPAKDTTWRSFCQNSMKHFEKAFLLKPEWLHAFYLGKICEKMGYSSEKALSYYSKAISLNPSAVDPLYRLHASRIKLLCGHGNRNLVVLQTVASYPFKESTTKAVSDMLGWASDCHRLPIDPKVGSMCDDSSKMAKPIEPQQLDEAWHLLYDDCLSGLEVCVEGELKHFHRARYRLAQGLYKRGEAGDFERAKDELGFCFRSSRSSFTINMWEIDSMVKKGRRKTPGPSGNRRCSEVTLPESSRKFITCIRKYVLFYTFLLEQTKDLPTLERAYSYIRTDKRFSLCLVDIVPVVLGRYIKVLSSLIHDAGSGQLADPSLTLEVLLERMFNVLLDHVNQLGDLGNLPEVKCPELSESSLYGYIHQYIHHLEIEARIDSLEGINERIRRRFKTPKLSNSNLSRICKHASIAWCRSILFKLASITPAPDSAAQPAGSSGATGVSESGLQLFVDLQAEEICRSSLEGSFYSKDLEERCHEALSRIRDAHVRQASEEHMEAAAALLRCAYNFFRDSSCGTFPSGIRLYTVSSLPVPEGVGALDLSVPRKLLLWAYTLMHGHYSSISSVMKFFEDNIKSRVRKGVAAPSASAHPAPPASSLQTGGAKERSEAGETPAVEETPTSEAQMPQFLGRQLLHQCSSSRASENSCAGSREDPGD